MPFVPDDILILIFYDIEPCFLMSVLLTCKRFNRLGMSEVFYTHKIQQYSLFSNSSINKRNDFITSYQQRYRKIKSSHVLKLLNFIIHNDCIQLKEFCRTMIDLSPIQKHHRGHDYDLFQMLQETDNDEKSILNYLNDQQNQTLCNIIFSACSTQLQGFASNGIRYFNPPLDDLYQLAAKLNQSDYIKSNMDKYLDHIYYKQQKVPHGVCSSPHQLLFLALVHAISYGYTEIVKILLPSVKLRIDNYVDLFEQAARYNQAQVVIELIQEGQKRIIDLIFLPHIIDVAARWGSTKVITALSSSLNNVEAVVTTACENGHLQTVQYLMEHFVISQKPVSPRCDIFLAAIRGGNLGIVQYIHEHYLFLTRKEAVLETPVEHACLYKQRFILEYLLANDFLITDRAKEIAEENQSDLLCLLQYESNRKRL